MYSINRTTGWLEGVDRIPSPNVDDRPAGVDIDMIVVHSISLPPGEFGGTAIESLFANDLNPDDHPYFAQLCDLRVSAHLLIRRDGSVVQFVSFQRRAWHAGESCFNGRSRCNDFSIGIEVEGSDDVPFEPCQYQVLADIVNALTSAYPAIKQDRIVGHSDIAPQRKTDPGPFFDWSCFFAQLARTGI